MTPNVRGVVDRRILVNYRVPAGSLAEALPEPFRPKEAEDGCGPGSVCIMRMKNERPRLLPSALGATVESVYDAVELRPYDRSMKPAKTINVKSSYSEAFEGSGFDSALLTEDVEHEWLSRNPVPTAAGS